MNRRGVGPPMVPPLRRGDVDCGLRRKDGTGGRLGAGAEAEEVGVAEGEGEADALAG